MHTKKEMIVPSKMKCQTYIQLVVWVSLLAHSSLAGASNENLQFEDDLIGHNPVMSELFGKFKLNELMNKTASIIDSKVYEKYLTLFNKSPKNGTDFERRFKLFAERVKQIVKSKVDFLAGRSSVALGINQFTDWDDDELFSSTPKDALNINPVVRNDRQSSFLDRLMQKYSEYMNKTKTGPQINNGLDLRDTGCVADPRSQGQCGACYAFSLMSVLETAMCLNPHFNPSREPPNYLSVQQLIDCFKSTDKAFGCNGGDVRIAYSYLAKFGFAFKENCYTFKQRRGLCRDSWIQDKSCFVPLTTNEQMLELRPLFGEKAMIEHLENSGSVLAYMYCNRICKFYSRGIIRKEHDERIFTNSFNHGVVIVGYGTSPNGVKYWLVKNSYGQNWGHGGYALIERGTNTLSMEAMPFGIEARKRH